MIDVLLAFLIGVAVLAIIVDGIYLWLTAIDRYPLAGPLSLLLLLLSAAFMIGFVILGALQGKW